MKLAIVGSRKISNHGTAQEIIRSVLARLKPSVVISGGADGIDKMAIDIARKELHLDTKIFEPAGKFWIAYKARNIQIAEACDYLVRIASRN